MPGNLQRPSLSSWPLVVVVIGALTAFRLWAMSRTDLVPDEAYYWLWSRFPSTGYYDHPPMIAWWIWLSTKVFGDTAFGVRVLPVLSVAVTSLAVYGTVIELYEEVALARRATVWLNAMLLISIAALFATPDAPSVMFWALDAWVLARLRRTGNPTLWIAIGLLAGAGCVSKYTNFFLGPGILLWVIVDPRAARWRLSPWLVVGGIAAFVVFLPVLLWNAGHGWISFSKQFGRIGDHHFGVLPFGEFFAGQFGLINPIIAIFSTLAVWRFMRRRDRRSDPSVFLVALTAPLLLYLTFHSLHDRVHPNWPAPAYPALAIAAAVAARRPRNGAHLRRLAKWASPVGVGISSILLSFVASPFGAEFPQRSPADVVIGWKDFTSRLEAERQKAGAFWIATTDYGVTGEIAFYSQSPATVQDIVGRQRYTFQQSDDSVFARPALLVMRASEHSLDQYLKCFGSADAVHTIRRQAAGRAIEEYLFVRVSRAKIDLLKDGCKVND